MIKVSLKLFVMTLCVTGLAFSVYAEGSDSKAGNDLTPLKIVLPKPMFTGTPKPVLSDNLEVPTGKPRPPFMAPKGAVNLALNKEVTATDDLPIIGEVEYLTDDDRDGADGSFVEFGPGLQHAQIDLGKVCEIYAIVVWHYHAESRAYRDVVVRGADDPDFLTNVKTIFNNDHNNSSGLGVGKDKEYIETNEGKLIDAKIDGTFAKARYIRLYSNGNTANDMNHYIEVEVYGKP